MSCEIKVENHKVVGTTVSSVLIWSLNLCESTGRALEQP